MGRLLLTRVSKFNYMDKCAKDMVWYTQVWERCRRLMECLPVPIIVNVMDVDKPISAESHDMIM